VNINRYLLWSGLLCIAALALGQECKAADFCKEISGKKICDVPFEAVYSNRSDLIEKRISIDGVLLAGVGGEFASVPTVLLFPSVEKAQVCDHAFAIEIVVDSKSLFDKLKISSGKIVNISGVLRRSGNGHWATLEITREPSILQERHELYPTCLKAPPPPPPPPPLPSSRQ
jgi:hypothetical protein